jgi:hypothetical protein
MANEKRFEFSWHLTRDEAISEAADVYAEANNVPVTPELLAEIDAEYENAREAEYDRQQERAFHSYWEG